MNGRVHELSLEELSNALRAAVMGSYPSEAAVELLITHGTWLRRDDFRDCVSYYEADPDFEFGHEAFAVVDWQALPSHVRGASSSEHAVLLVAASLASDEVSVRLRDAVVGLDRSNSTAVARAVLWAAGHRYASVNLHSDTSGDA